MEFVTVNARPESRIAAGRMKEWPARSIVASWKANPSKPAIVSPSDITVKEKILYPPAVQPLAARSATTAAISADDPRITAIVASGTETDGLAISCLSEL